MSGCWPAIMPLEIDGMLGGVIELVAMTRLLIRPR
jgi:hypothetical protein